MQPLSSLSRSGGPANLPVTMRAVRAASDEICSCCDHPCATLAVPLEASAQVPVTALSPEQQLEALKDADPKEAANKKLVYDFWREVFVGRDMTKAETYMAESYIQHNPNVPTGRAPFVAFFGTRPASPQSLRSTISSRSSATATSSPLHSAASCPTRQNRVRLTLPPGSTCSASKTARSPSTGTTARSSRPRRRGSCRARCNCGRKSASVEEVNVDAADDHRKDRYPEHGFNEQSVATLKVLEGHRENSVNRCSSKLATATGWRLCAKSHRCAAGGI